MNEDLDDKQRIDWYKNKLSPFGQKVLGLLVEQWNTERMGQSCFTSVKQRQNETQRKRVLKGSNTHTSAKTLEQIQESLEQIETLPTLKTIEFKSTVKEDLRNNVFDRFDLINSGIDLDQNEAHYDKIGKDKHHVQKEDIALLNTQEISPGLAHKPGNVNWLDMFDINIFQDTAVSQKDITSAANVQQQTNDEIDFASSSLFKINSIEESNNKPVKRKKSQKHTTKKVKKLLPQPNTLRKVKYTKSVNTWLNDIDKNTLPEAVGLTTKHQFDNEAMETEDNTSKEVRKPTVIQTKLANKDGVMKYRMPGPAAIPSGKVNEKTVVSEKNTPAKDVLTKFIAPIKSQIPVKDVTYDVITVDDTNIENHIKLTNDHAEVLIVIIYSNGFCQLNSNYTADICIPDGILLHVNDDNERFLYMNKFDGKVKEMMPKFLGHSTLICYDGKIVLKYLLQFIKFRPYSVLDVKIGGALLEPDKLPENFTQVQESLAFTPEYTIASDDTLQKVAWYADLLKKCACKLKALLIENSLWEIFVELEMRLVPIIADMERHGISVDEEKVKSMEQTLLRKMRSVERACHAAAGRAFQIHSPPQVRALLYGELRLRPGAPATASAASTSEAALRALVPAHPLPRLILQYRRLHKALATFVQGIAHHVRGGVLRPTWVQIAAATGRIAARNPNLQAIPKSPFNLAMYSESEIGDGADGADGVDSLLNLDEPDGGAIGADEPDGVLGDDEPDGALGANEPDSALGADEPDGVLGTDEPDGVLGADKPDGVLGPDEPDGVLGTDEPDGVLGTDEPDGVLGTDEPDVVSAAGAAGAETLHLRAVLVARRGCVLLAADFRHVECRVFAAAAADATLLGKLQHDDLFRALAAEWLQKSEAAVSAAERECTKRAVYAALYGAGAATLRAALGGGAAVNAHDVLASFHRAFPSLRGFGARVAAACARGGRLRTAGGRARRFPALGGPPVPPAARARALRQAVSFVVQGSAADVCKLAMVRADERLRARPPPRARLLLQLHDELVWEVPRPQLLHAAGVVAEAMESCGRCCGVRRLPVALRAGPDWGSMAPLALPPPRRT